MNGNQDNPTRPSGNGAYIWPLRTHPLFVQIVQELLDNVETKDRMDTRAVGRRYGIPLESMWQFLIETFDPAGEIGLD